MQALNIPLASGTSWVIAGPALSLFSHRKRGTEFCDAIRRRRYGRRAHRFHRDRDAISIDLWPHHPSTNSPLRVIRAMRGPTLTSTFFHLATNHRPLKMNRNTALATVAVVLILALSTAYAELVHWTPCPSSSSSSSSSEEACTIHEVHVDPCREAEERKPCTIKKGRNATINFDYTPQFSGSSLSSRAYWASELVDLPFLGMPLDACLSTVCPAAPGQKQSYSVILPISKKFPVRTYNLKWKLWNEEEQECCFMFQIKLVK